MNNDPYNPEKFLSYRHFVGGLVRQSEPENVLEIGLGHGTTAAKVIQAMEENKKGHYYCITLFVHFNLLEDLKLPKNRYTIIDGNSLNSSLYANFPMMDLICIDGNHAEDYVYQDARICYPKLKDNGLYVFHDANTPQVASAINRASQELNLATFYFPEFYTSIARKMPKSNEDFLHRP